MDPLLSEMLARRHQALADQQLGDGGEGEYDWLERARQKPSIVTKDRHQRVVQPDAPQGRQCNITAVDLCEPVTLHAVAERNLDLRNQAHDIPEPVLDETINATIVASSEGGVSADVSAFGSTSMAGKMYNDDLKDIDKAEMAIKHQYNPKNNQWARTLINVVVQPQPFAEGNLRKAFHIKDLSVTESHYVLKISKDPSEDPQSYFDDVQLQMEAKMYAELYNASNPPKKVDFLDAYVLELKDRPDKPICAVEKYIKGEYKKYNNNWNFCDERRNTPQAFSHFTYEKSNHKILVCDIQGVGDTWTDPQIHSHDGTGYGKGNLGQEGIDKFLESHKCNKICQFLGLPIASTIKNRRSLCSQAIADTCMSTQITPAVNNSTTIKGENAQQNQLLVAEIQKMGFNAAQVRRACVALGGDASEEAIVDLLIEDSQMKEEILKRRREDEIRRKMQAGKLAELEREKQEALQKAAAAEAEKARLAEEAAQMAAELEVVRRHKDTWRVASFGEEREQDARKNLLNAVNGLRDMGFSSALIEAAQAASMSESADGVCYGDSKEIKQRLLSHILECQEQEEKANRATIRALQEEDATRLRQQHGQVGSLLYDDQEDSFRQNYLRDHSTGVSRTPSTSPNKVVDYKALLAAENESLYPGQRPPTRPPPRPPAASTARACTYGCGVICDEGSEDSNRCAYKASTGPRTKKGISATFMRLIGKSEHACCLCLAIHGWEGFDQHACAQCKAMRQRVEEREQNREWERAIQSRTDTMGAASNPPRPAPMEYMPQQQFSVPHQQQLMMQMQHHPLFPANMRSQYSHPQQQQQQQQQKQQQQHSMATPFQVPRQPVQQWVGGTEGQYQPRFSHHNMQQPLHYQTR